eukprot:scaffold53700_cov64-Phaeocystis_antarctica.AAC.1
MRVSSSEYLQRLKLKKAASGPPRPPRSRRLPIRGTRNRCLKERLVMADNTPRRRGADALHSNQKYLHGDPRESIVQNIIAVAAHAVLPVPFTPKIAPLNAQCSRAAPPPLH